MTVRNPSRFLSLVLLLTLVGVPAAAATEGQTPALISKLTPEFAIGDFDGDFHPDVASVQAGRSFSSQTDYWIQLRLTAAGRHSIRFVGPVGGLLIEARDVNGDHALDLILITPHRKPLAVFLNDGHGNFSRVERNVSPAEFAESSAKWTTAFDHAYGAVGVPPQSSVGSWAEVKGVSLARAPTVSISFLDVEPDLNTFLISHAGRAPPFAVPHL